MAEMENEFFLNCEEDRKKLSKIILLIMENCSYTVRVTQYCDFDKLSSQFLDSSNEFNIRFLGKCPDEISDPFCTKQDYLSQLSMGYYVTREQRFIPTLAYILQALVDGDADRDRLTSYLYSNEFLAAQQLTADIEALEEVVNNDYFHLVDKVEDYDFSSESNSNNVDEWVLLNRLYNEVGILKTYLVYGEAATELTVRIKHISVELLFLQYKTSNEIIKNYIKSLLSLLELYRKWLFSFDSERLKEYYQMAMDIVFPSVEAAIVFGLSLPDGYRQAI